MSVYFVYAKQAKKIKIGYSSNPKKRLASLKTASPFGLIILATVKGDKNLERAVHAKFRHLRENGEWFRGTEELFEWIHDVRKKRYIPIIKVTSGMSCKEYEEKIVPFERQGYVPVSDIC